MPISSWQFALSLLIFISFSWVFHRNYFGISQKRQFGINFLISLGLFLLCLLFAGSIYDTSFDGTWYHLDAVHLLKNGWNPSYKMLSEEETSYCSKYLNHFPKVPWIYAALVAKVTGNVEMGKAANLQLIISCLFVAQHMGRAIFKLSALLSWILAFLIASNPIQILNLGSFYVDGQVSSLTFLGMAFAIYQVVEGGWVKGFLALLAFALLANIKFPSAFYAILYVGAFLGFLWFTKAYKWQKMLTIALFWGVFTFGVLGWNPYMSNLIRMGHPLYPLSEGTEKVFKKEENYPANFLNTNRFERFFRSFYAEPKWARNPETSDLKTLFSHVPLYTYDYGVPDLAGFGPFTPEVFLLLFPLGLWVLFELKGKERKNAVFILSVLLIATFINPEAWVMRYVPQFWIFLVILVLLVLQRVKWQGPGFVLAVGLLLNNLTLLNQNIVKSYVHTSELKEQLNEVATSNGKIEFYPGWAKSFQYRLTDVGLDLQKQTYIPETDTSANKFTGGLGALYRKRKTE